MDLFAKLVSSDRRVKSIVISLLRIFHFYSGTNICGWSSALSTATSSAAGSLCSPVSTLRCITSKLSMPELLHLDFQDVLQAKQCIIIYVVPWNAVVCIGTKYPQGSPNKLDLVHNNKIKLWTYMKHQFGRVLVVGTAAFEGTCSIWGEWGILRQRAKWPTSIS